MSTTQEKIRKAKAQGYSDNQIRTYLSSSKVPFEESFFSPEPVQQPQSFLQDVKGDFLGVGRDILSSSQKRADTITGIRGQMESGQKNDASAIFQTAGQVAGAGADAIGSVFKGAVKLALTPKGEQRTMELVSNFGQEVVQRPETQKLISWYEGLAPETQDNLDAVGGFASLAAEFIGVGAGQRGATVVKEGVSSGLDVARQGVKRVVGSSDDAFNIGTELRNNIQLSIAKKNVSPQLESSSKRLFAEGTKRLEDPVMTYDKFLEQSKLGVTDIYGDTALGQVGGKMGDAFETVIKDRRAVGATMGSEIKKFGALKINIEDSFPKFEQELADSGVTYSNGKVKLSDLSKITEQDASLINDYITKLNKLGANPSAAQLDAFLSKIPADLKVFKAKNNITDVTNGERMIKGNLANITNTLIKNPGLSKYAIARKAYSDLSDFIDDGTTFLGKKTQSGDFARDASVAKSAVQSILNSGKKDWMIKLRALTGYNALDESVLALQAMKDAGDFRGLSLNQTQSELIGLISEGGLPTSKAGFTQKVIDFAMEKGGKVLAGTPEEQTRAFLQSLKNESTQTIKKPTKTTPANTGASTKKINQSKTSDIVISPKTTPPPNFSKGVIPNSKKANK